MTAAGHPRRQTAVVVRDGPAVGQHLVARRALNAVERLERLLEALRAVGTRRGLGAAHVGDKAKVEVQAGAAVVCLRDAARRLCERERGSMTYPRTSGMPLQPSFLHCASSRSLVLRATFSTLRRSERAPGRLTSAPVPRHRGLE